MKLTKEHYHAALQIWSEFKKAREAHQGNNSFDVYCCDRIIELSNPAGKQYKCIKACFDFTVGVVIVPNDSRIWPVDKLPEYFEEIKEQDQYTLIDTYNDLCKWSKESDINQKDIKEFERILDKIKAELNS